MGNLLYMATTTSDFTLENLSTLLDTTILSIFLLGCVMYATFTFLFKLSDFCSRVNKLAEKTPEELENILKQISEIECRYSDISKKVDKISDAIERKKYLS